MFPWDPVNIFSEFAIVCKAFTACLTTEVFHYGPLDSIAVIKVKSCDIATSWFHIKALQSM